MSSDFLGDNNPILAQLNVTRCSTKKDHIVEAYAAISHEGIVRTYNEDRIAIINNIGNSSGKFTGKWPHIHFFGVYDGHGGSGCADYLRVNLHHFVKASLIVDNQ